MVETLSHTFYKWIKFNPVFHHYQAPVPGKPISPNPGLNPHNPGLRFIPRLVSVPESSISAIQGIN